MSLLLKTMYFPIVTRVATIIACGLLLFSLVSCSYTVYSPETNQEQPGARVAELEKEDCSSGPELDPAVSFLEPDLTALPVGLTCPDAESTRLIRSRDFSSARAVLEEDLQHVKKASDRQCVLLSLGVLHALPDTDELDVEKAQQYQLLAIKIDDSQSTSAHGMMDHILVSLLTMHEQNQRLQKDNATLQLDLKNKEAAIAKLKALTLGGG